MWETSALQVLFVFSFNFYIFLACLFQDKAWTSSSRTLYAPQPFWGGCLLSSGLRMISSWQLRLSQMAGQSEGQQRNSECLSLLCTIEFLVVLHLVPKVALLGIWQMDRRGEGTDQLLSGLCQHWIRLFKEASDILGKRNCCQEDRHKTWGGYGNVTHNWLCELQAIFLTHMLLPMTLK